MTMEKEKVGINLLCWKKLQYFNRVKKGWHLDSKKVGGKGTGWVGKIWGRECIQWICCGEWLAELNFQSISVRPSYQGPLSGLVTSSHVVNGCSSANLGQRKGW